MRVLNVAEKPSVAKALSEILSNGGARSSSGFNKYCRVHKFQCSFAGQEAQMVFTSVLGHLYSLQFERKTAWHEIDPVQLFDEKVCWEIPANMQDVSKTLSELSAQCSMLVIWTDCDREGENIGMQIANLVKDKIGTVRRARFSGLSRYEVLRALESLDSINKNEATAVASRIEIDLRIGAAITRLQTLQLQDILEKKAVISYGSCQIPTLGFVCEREESMEEFVEEKNWTLQAEVKSNGERGTFDWARGKIYDEEYVRAKHEWVSGFPMTVSKLEKKKVQKWRPYPLRTVELQKFFAKGQGISSSHELMGIAESLYTSGYISYPRTETDAFPQGFNYSEPLGMLKSDPVLRDYAARLKPVRPLAGKNNDQAHTPIYPLKAGTGLKGKDRMVYEYVARRFLACYSENAEGEEELIECLVRGECFVRKTLKVLKKNYLEVFIYEKWGDTEADLGVCLGQEVFSEVAKKESHTEKPHLLTEAELIAKMDKNGIGTDATIHDHIQRIKERAYVEVVGKNALKSTWLGRSLINGYKSIGLQVSKPHLRKEFESNLKKVCAGEYPPQELVRQELSKYRGIYIEMQENMGKFKAEFAKNKQATGGPGEDRPGEHPYIAPKKATANSPGSSYGGKSGKSGKSRQGTPPEKALSGAWAEEPECVDNEYVKRKKQMLADVGPKSGQKTEWLKTLGSEKKARDSSFLADLPPGAVVCDCNIEAGEKTVKKDGPNQGKQFYSCAAGQCNYFLWKGAEKSSAARPQSSSLSRTEAPPARSRPRPAPQANSKVQCACGLDAKYFLSKTAKNNNRGFFKCNKSYKQCTFFMWEDEANK
ncbi:DNA topoisomerase III [Nematocida major]|uniref:DNA topoisomerase III n=1 Tax=Nematocida major TaxID=1912982 RepID=UPI0020086EA8|nr:DNA topoisomerase III [Nematocida major]KAH9386353.1 DNA topoisomerase III [Nematocida major]